MQSMSQTILNKRKYPKYYSNQISKHFDNQKRVFKGVVLYTLLPPQDFIPSKSPGLIGLNIKIVVLFVRDLLNNKLVIEKRV